MTPDAGTHADRLVIYPSRAKMSLVLLGSIAFVVAGVWIGTSGVARGLPIWDVVIASYIGVPLLNLAWGFAPINVPQVVLRMKVAELADLLHARHGVRVERDA